MKNLLARVLLLATCILALSMVNGCSCWKDPLGRNNKANTSKKPETLEEMEARRKELQEKQEEKADFETVRLHVLPSDDAPTRNQVKPGHWFSAVQTMKANKFDFPKGELQAQCVDTRGEPIPLPGTEFDLSTTRPVSLPKGQQKHFDLLLFANMPPRKGAINFITRLRPKGGGREVDWKFEATTRMKPFQNHMIVLSERPDNYQFVKTLRTVKPQRPSDAFLSTELDYFVKLPKGTRRVDVPSHPLTWSNVAYVIWDDFEPEILSADQQQAMIDWLHWGGQIVINGPRTLDRLNSSAFADFLPARSGSVGVVTDEQVRTLNENWSFDNTEARQLQLKEKEDPPLAIELQLTDDAQFVPGTAELVAEKRVGRGRLVTTAFNLPHSVFQSWDSYDSFFNACLLGRPARKFYEVGGAVVEKWVGSQLVRDDPRTTSAVRYFTRDAMAITTRTKRFGQQSPQLSNRQNFGFQGYRYRPTVPVGSDNSAIRSISVLPTAQAFPISGSQSSKVGPFFEVNLQGPEIIEPEEEATYVIRFKNSGNVLIPNARISVSGSRDLMPVSAMPGYGTSRNGTVLTWRIDPMPPGFGHAIEVVCSCPPNPRTTQTQISVQIVGNQGSEEAVLDVDVDHQDTTVFTDHPVERVASQAFAVNGFAKDDLIGVAGWSDNSDVSQEARKSLQQAAGISVPSVDFIARVLGVYLLILVPLNWLLFRIIGRVEWAWAAVPFIAIGGALGVVKAAELDIGFARSRTEIAIVELQPNYDRAHVTRYLGFYTSLTSSYEVSGEDTSTLIQPFASSQPISNRKVALYQGDKVSLSGFSILSNSTGLVHGEQMLDVGGAITLDEAGGKSVLRNDTEFDLQGTAVVRRRFNGEVEVAWIGDLSKQEKKPDVEFTGLQTANVAFEEWDSLPATSNVSEEGELNIRRLMEIATDPRRLGYGESVLIGWNETVIPGIAVKPQASQVTARTLFVAQLAHARRPDPKRDANCFAIMDRDLKARKKSGETDEFNF